MVSEPRQALRLWTAPTFTVVAVSTFVDAVLFRPLPFHDPDRLGALSERHMESGQQKVGVLPGSVLDGRERSQSFEYTPSHRTVRGDAGTGGAERSGG